MRIACLGSSVIPLGLAVLLASQSGADVIKGYLALQNGDYKTAISEYKSSVLGGDQKALESLGHAYEEFARATLKNRGDYKAILEAGIRDLLPFADEGKAEAQYAVGNLYEFKSQPLEAAKWLRRAADQEHAMAQWQLGSMYLIGRTGSDGLDQDLYQARNWLGRAATTVSILGWKPWVASTRTGKASRETTR